MENNEKDLKIEELTIRLETLIEEYQGIRKKYELDESEIVRLQNEIENLRKKLKHFEDQKRELEDLNDQWEKSARVLEYSKQALEERLNSAEEIAILYKEEIEELALTKDIEVQRLKDQYNELKQEMTTLTIDKSEKPKSPRRHRAEIVVLSEGISILSKPQSRNNSKPPSSNQSRGHSRKNSGESSEGTQSVKVVIRVRPSLKEEVWDKNFFSISPTAIQIRELKGKIMTDPKIFEFETIVTPDQNEDSMFNEIKDSIDKVIEGKNACVLAYGQTGSGKTYTMNSIIEKSIGILKNIDHAEVFIQCIEVYNEQVKDLNHSNVLNKNTKDVSDNSEIKLEEFWSAQALEIIKNAISRRTTKFTDCNEKSSRSHAIFTLTFITASFTSKIQFVDLAGSERVGKSGVSGDTLKEALLINKSLSALQDVISALESKSKHVPYRNSMLTKLLQPTLGGAQSLVTMIVNCSPSQDSLNETACTLALASRVKAVDLGFFIRKNLKNKEVERTLSLLEKERNEKNSLLRTLDKLQRDLENYQFAVKDRDNKISMLNNKIKLQSRAYQEVRSKPKIEISRTESPKKKLRAEENKNPKNKNLIHLNMKEIGRVVSLSPKVRMPNCPSFGNKPTKIPIPSFVNLKFGNNVD